jgi:hypothetical protein
MCRKNVKLTKTTSFILNILAFLFIKVIINIGFEVLTAVAMKSSIFLVITPCSSVKVYLRFGTTYHHYLRDQGASQGVLYISCWLLTWLTL